MSDCIWATNPYTNFIVILFLGVQSGPHERRLINDLMDRYLNLERPVYNESEAINLKFGLTLQQIIDVVSFQYEQAHYT